MSLKKKILREVLKIEEGEGSKTLLMFFYLFTAVGAFVMGRITRDTLFLKRFSISYLPYMYIATPLVTSITAYIYSKFIDRIRRDKFSIIVSLALFTFLLFLWTQSKIISPSIYYPGLYIFIEMMGMLTMIQFWTLANDIFTSRQAKRLFGLIGSGGVLASTFCGFFIKSSIVKIGIDNMILVVAVAIGLCAFFAFIVGSIAHTEVIVSMKPPSPGRASGIGIMSSSGKILSTPYLKAIAVSIIVTSLTTTLVDYQFKILASEYFDEIKLAGFFGTFYGITGILSIVFQFFLTGRLLVKMGILPSLLFLPIGIGLGSFTNLFLPSLSAVSIAKGSETSIGYTINNASLQVLYSVLPGYIRGRVKTFLEGILKQWAIGLSGLIFIALSKTNFRIHHYSSIALVSIGIWILFLFITKREYLNMLLKSLKGRGLAIEDALYLSNDSATFKILEKSLMSEDEGEVLRAIEISLQIKGFPIDKFLKNLLNHSSNKVQVEALKLITLQGDCNYLHLIKERLCSSDPLVASEAIKTYCIILKEKAVPEVTQLLSDSNPQIMLSAASNLVKYGGFDGIITGVETLKKMLEAENEETRAEGAKTLGDIGFPSFYKPILRLFNDRSRQVRIAAIEASGKIKSPDLILPLIYLLEDRRSIPYVVTALSNFGTGIEESLGRVLANEEEPLYIREPISDVLVHIGTQKSVDILASRLSDPAFNLRAKIYRGLYRVMRLKPELSYPQKLFSSRLNDEIVRGYFWFTLLSDIKNSPYTDPLQDAIEYRIDLMLKAILYLFGMLHPGTNIEAIYYNLKSSSRVDKSHAIEIIDNMAKGNLRKIIIPLIDDTSLKEKVEFAKGFTDLRNESIETRLKQLLKMEEPWITSCTLFTIGNAKFKGFEEWSSSALTNHDTLVRETALFVIKGSPKGDDKMISTIERVLFLKSINLFSQIPGEYLALVAQIAQEESIEKGEVVFKEGDAGDSLYLIIEGTVKVHKGEREIATLNAGECFGEMAILDSEHRSASVTALNDCLFLKISREDFCDIMKERPEIAEGIIKVLLKRLRSA